MAWLERPRPGKRHPIQNGDLVVCAGPPRERRGFRNRAPPYLPERRATSSVLVRALRRRARDEPAGPKTAYQPKRKSQRKLENMESNTSDARNARNDESRFSKTHIAE